MTPEIKPIYIKILVALGVLVALLPFIGIGSFVVGYISFAAGIAIAAISYFLYRQIFPAGKHPDAIHDEQTPTI